MEKNKYEYDINPFDENELEDNDFSSMDYIDAVIDFTNAGERQRVYSEHEVNQTIDILPDPRIVNSDRIRQVQNGILTIINRYRNSNNELTKIITSAKLSAVLQDSPLYVINPRLATEPVTTLEPYLIGSIGGIGLYTDAYLRWNDGKIYFFRDDSLQYVISINDPENILF